METDQNQMPSIRRFERGQGLVEYSLILTFVALVCISILVVLGRSTRSSIQKVNCAIDSTAAQCSCLNETLNVSSTFPNGCSGTSLVVTVTSSCSGTTLTVNGVNKSTPGSFTWASAPVCTGAATTFTVKSTQPDGTVKNYSASRP